MTTLILAHKRIAPLGRLLFSRPIQIAESFADVNKKNLITAVLGAILTISVVSYIISMYLVFQWSFALHTLTVGMEKLQDAIVLQQAQLQDRKANLLTAYPLLLQSMDTVSNVKYLEPRDFTASAIKISP